MAVLNTADRIYLNGQEVDRVYLDGVQVYSKINLYQLFKDRVLVDNGTFIENPIVFNNEKLLLTPNAYKENKLYSALPIDGSGDFTFSRNSSATYIEDGIIKTAQANVPRIQDGKILIEEQSTNLIKNSTIINATNWLVREATLESGFSSPDGLNNAFKYKTNLVINNYNLFREQSTYSLNNSISIYIKNIDAQYFYIRGSLGYYDFVNDISTSTRLIAHHIGDGWIKLIANNINQSNYSQFGIGEAENDLTAFDQSVLIYAPQREDNNARTSYIPTNGTAVTRLADIATVTPPIGTSQIIETIDGVEQAPITTIPPTYQLPVGNIDNVKMI